MDIHSELLKYSPLDSLQVSLLVKLSQLISFGESITRHEIRLFAPLIGKPREHQHYVLVIESNGQNLHITKHKSTSEWTRLLESGNCMDTFSDGEYIFPVIDNGGKVIGGISFSPVKDVQSFDAEREFIVADTMQRLMLTAPEGQIDTYEPISYLDGLIIFDHNGTILYGNEGVLHLADILGIDRRLVGTSIFSSSLKMSAIHQVLLDRMPYMSEEIYHHMVIQQHLIPVPMGRNESRCFLILHDCTRESKQQQELLVKNSIIKEIHHRVKNNLQTVAGLLRMEARRSNLPDVKLALQESISRIESMALVHDLVSHYDEDYISIRSIYDELCRLLRHSMVNGSQEVEFRFSGDECIVSSHRASHISLIINELITNSLEHGLCGQDGTISLSIHKEDDDVTLVLTDSGNGFPKDFDIHKSKRLGMQIINNLVTHELQGTMDIGNDNGATVTIIMKNDSE